MLAIKPMHKVFPLLKTLTGIKIVISVNSTKNLIKFLKQSIYSKMQMQQKIKEILDK